MPSAYFYLFLAIASEVIATTLLKASFGFTKIIPTILILTCYALAFWLLAMAVKSIPLGVAYALWSGIGIVAITLFAWHIYNQKLDNITLLGIIFICTGTVLVSLNDIMPDIFNK